jgi:hypothetical protein
MILLRHQHRDIVVRELRAQEPRIAALRIVARRQEAIGIVGVMVPHQQAAEAAHRRQILWGGGADGERACGRHARRIARGARR